MIDYRTYRRFHPEAPVFRQERMTPASIYDRRPLTLQQDSVPIEEDFYMMPPNVHGFVIQDKKWGELLQLYTYNVICN
jgi:hypothetical protein